jgi:hypothetical protein
MTSWIAIASPSATRSVTGPSREQLIPQELPYGTSASAFGLRAPQQRSTRAGSAPMQMGVVRSEQLESVARSLSLDSLEDGQDRAFDDDDDVSPGGASFDMEGGGDYDFGEAAPSESFDEAERAPAPARSRAARSAPMPGSAVPSSPVSRLSGGYGAGKSSDDDPFATEEPTGQVAAAPTFDDKRKELAPEPEPRMAARQPRMAAPRAAAPAKTRTVDPLATMQSYSEQPLSGDNALMLPPQQPPLKQRTRWSMVLGLALVLALLALLLWWLFA